MKSNGLLVGALFVISILGFGCSAKVTTSVSAGGTGTVSVSTEQPSVTQLALTDDPSTKQPKDSFTPDTAKVYAEAEVDSINEGDKVKTAFVCDSAINPANKQEIKDQTINSVTQTLKAGMKGVQASLSKPTNGWPVGDYHVDVYINDKLAKSAKFSVAAAKS